MTNYRHIYNRIFSKLGESLNSKLTYHNLEHTKWVLNCARKIAEIEGVNPRELLLVEMAALFHDTGFLVSREAHEERGCALARVELENEDFSLEEIESICGMIMATKIPQSPKTQLERILADADLYYLGTDEYEKYANLLYQELREFNPALTEKDWKQIQIKFLGGHRYKTDFAKTKLEPRKQIQLAKIKNS